MAAGKYTFTIEQGTTTDFQIDWKDSNGQPVDLTLYRNMDSFIFNDKIKNIYIGLGIFKNSEKNLLKDRLYFHYSLDIVF